MLVVLLFLLNVPVISFGLALTLLYLTKNWSWLRARRIVPLDPSPVQLRRELVWGISTRFVDVGATIAAVIAFKMEFTFEVSWLRDSIAVVGALIFFEVWYYISHRVFHLPGFRAMHAIHHSPAVTTPLTSTTLFPIERLLNDDLGYLIPWIVMSYYGAIPIWAMAVHGHLIALLSIYGHCNLRLFSSANGVSDERSIIHSIHHLSNSRNFGFLTPAMDWMFSTHAGRETYDL